MAHVSHVAAWTIDLDATAAFYATFFDGFIGDLYQNPRKGFASRFLTFEAGPRLELMHQAPAPLSGWLATGYAHLAFGLGSATAVDELTEALKTGGHRVVGGPRRTGDGFYESTVLDPEGNLIELTP
jgi:lactoylglutathione lyase